MSLNETGYTVSSVCAIRIGASPGIHQLNAIATVRMHVIELRTEACAAKIEQGLDSGKAASLQAVDRLQCARHQPGHFLAPIDSGV